jgi:hypothetical protein
METGRAFAHQCFELVGCDGSRYVGWGRAYAPWTRLPASVATWAERTAAKLEWRWLPSCVLDKRGARALAEARREQVRAWDGTLIGYTREARPVACRTPAGDVLRFASTRAAARWAGVWQTSIVEHLRTGCLDSRGNAWFDDCAPPLGGSRGVTT